MWMFGMQVVCLVLIVACYTSIRHDAGEAEVYRILKLQNNVIQYLLDRAGENIHGADGKDE